MYKVFAIIALNLIFFFRTLRYRYAVDDWENARCGCKQPDFVRTETVRNNKKVAVDVCKKCGILKRVEPKNLWQKFIWSFGGLLWITDENGEKNTTTQYTDPVFDHLITMILHIINSVLVYFAFGANDVSFLAAVMFSIHPAAMQGSSVWLSGKGYAAGLMFCLLAYWLKPAAPLFYAIGSWYVAVLVMPFVFLHSPYWPMIIMAPLAFLWRKKMLKAAIEYKYNMVKLTRDPFHWHNIILVFKTIGYYLALCVFPVRLGVHHEYIAMYGVTDKDTKECLDLRDKFFWIGIAFVLATAYMFFWHWGPVALGMMWFLVFIMPWSNWMAAVNQPIAERYAVIALVGAIYAVANLIIGYPVIYAMLLTYYATVSSFFMPAYRHILHYAVYNVVNFPRSFQGWLWKSDVERNFRLIERSFDSAMQAWVVRPEDFLVNNNVATLLLMQRRYGDAEPFLQRMAKAPMPTKDMEAKRDAKVAMMRQQIANDMAAMQAARERTIQGRNEPCGCGSGIKFKKCCGKTT